MTTDAERRAKRNAYMRKWRHNNPDYRRKANAYKRSRWYKDKARATAYAREWRARNRDHVRAYRYGITATEWQAMKAKGCGICQRHLANLVIDHCHATGQVRGALCHTCNSALGKFRDSPVLLHKALAWLSQGGGG